MRNLHLDQVNEAQEFKRLSPGGYLCKITSIADVPNREYIKIEYEIADGQHKGFCRRVADATGFWPGNFIKSYKENALPFFKGMITAIEQSNPNYKWDNDERKLVGKWIGLVLGEEEYKAKDGTIKTRLYVDQIRSGQKIRNNDFEIPTLKRLKQTPSEHTTYDTIPLENENPGYGCDEVPF